MNRICIIGPVAVVALALASCAAAHPVYDMRGVDTDKFYADKQACLDSMPGVSFGDYVARCMEKKGYRIMNYE